MALEIPQSDRIYNLEPLPDNFDPDDPRQINATWIMRMFDKIVNGEYKMKSFKVYANFSDLPNNAEQGETAYITADEYKNSFFIYNGSSWTMASGGGSGIVDDTLSTVSTNPVQNKVITNRINQVAASIPIVDTTLSPTSTNTIQNKVVTNALSEKQDILNEFTITQAIFDNYKNANNYADLEDIISSESISNSVINLNNYNFFLNNLIVSNKTLLFKNGNIVFDSNGVNGTCDKAIVASSCNIGFRDCQISAINCAGITNTLIDLNNTNLTFDNVIADDIKVSSTKTIIQTTNTCNVKITESDIEILNNETPIDSNNFSNNKISW